MHSKYPLLSSVISKTTDTGFQWFKKSKWVFQSKIISMPAILGLYLQVLVWHFQMTSHEFLKLDGTLM